MDVLNRTKCARKAFTGNTMAQVIDLNDDNCTKSLLKTTGMYFTELCVEEDPFLSPTTDVKNRERKNETENNFINIYIYIYQSSFKTPI